MTLSEIEQMKVALKGVHKLMERQWLEKQILRNLIIDSGWMSESELDSGVAVAAARPDHIRLAAENFAASEQSLAEIGLEHLTELLEKLSPRTD